MGLIWITGLANSGKTSLAEYLVKEIKKLNSNIIHLDGDEIRKILNLRDNSFLFKERKKLSYQYASLCKLLSDQGSLVVISTISMFEDVRVWNRKNNQNYFEVYIKASLKKRIIRDSKKVYQKKNIVEFNKEYQEPKNPDYIYQDKNKKKLLEIIIKNFL